MESEQASGDDGHVHEQALSFRKVEVHPYDDRRRVKVLIDLAPTQVRANLEIKLYDPDGQQVTEALVVGQPDEHMVLTLHLRGGIPSGPYTAKFSLTPQDGGDQAYAETRFDIPPSGSQEQV